MSILTEMLQFFANFCKFAKFLQYFANFCKFLEHLFYFVTCVSGIKIKVNTDNHLSDM